MKAPLFALLASIAVAALSSADTVNFDNFKAGAAPTGWTATQVGSGSAKWSVEKDDSAPSKPNVLKQSGEATFPVCIKNDSNLKDGFVEVKLKPIAGKEDQAGGVIWRVQDANNYYIARANALEDNVTIYHTINGKRVAFKSINAKVTSGVWHTLRVEFQGNKFAVIFDGNKVIDATDESFANAGKVGVWTKADSVTEFDNFTFGAR
jgi:outer membrane protein assembly factor BamE (lipoprotein component of BamABCDE complex)